MHDPGNALVLVAILVALYFLPTIVAYRRGHHNTLAIFFLNLFLGWTFIGWVVALVWGLTVVAGNKNESRPRH